MLVPQCQARGDGARVQQRKTRKDGWTRDEKRQFLEVLAETCNASEAARAVGKSRPGAYALKARNAAFARGWDAAVDQGYAEIEAMLMRAVLFGYEEEEITLDGEGAVKGRKLKRGNGTALGLQLLKQYAERVARIRAAKGAGGGAGGPAGGAAARGPASADAIARVDRVLAEIRRRRAAAA